MGATSPPRQERRHTSFDVICAGKPLWRVEGLARTRVRYRSGLFHTAGLLSRMGVRVGLATVIDDDTFGRAWLEETSALGVDVGGVTLATPATSLVVVDADGGQSVVLAEREQERGLDVPTSWSSQVLLLSGLSPVTATAAALCKAARRARRDGTMVVLDLMAGLRVWAGSDPRTISMVLREADIVRCSLADLAVLRMDAASVRRALRSSATLVVNDTLGAVAAGTFGEVRCVLAKGDVLRAEGAGDACTAAICADWARPSKLAESLSGRWNRVLQGWASTVGAMASA
jgi:2-dehydro-3-deoxygluconokinase